VGGKTHEAQFPPIKALEVSIFGDIPMNRFVSRPLILMAVLLCIFAPTLHSQGFSVDPALFDGRGGFWIKWDVAQQALVFYRDSKETQVPAVRVFESSGTNVPIYPLQDLAEAQYVEIWSVAATPQKGVILSGLVRYTPKGVKPANLRRMLLSYDAFGRLEKVWNVSPYWHDLVAVDQDGNVFALGANDDKEPYPLLVKYSPTGDVLRRFLNSNLFAEGERVLANASPYGDNQMFVSANRLYVWFAGIRELFQFTLAGELVNRTSLSRELDDLAAATHSSRVKVQVLAPGQEGSLVAEVQLWPTEAGKPVKPLLVQLRTDGSATQTLDLSSHLAQPAWFIGTTEQAKLVFLEPGKDGKAGKLTIY
jgi:hypothetical protein